jgi:hypothetical protein
MTTERDDLMRVVIDGKDVFVPYVTEVLPGGIHIKRPNLDESNLIDITTLGSDAPEYISAHS